MKLYSYFRRYFHLIRSIISLILVPFRGDCFASRPLYLTRQRRSQRRNDASHRIARYWWGASSKFIEIEEIGEEAQIAVTHPPIERH